jgi:hypothetical protein
MKRERIDVEEELTKLNADALSLVQELAERTDGIYTQHMHQRAKKLVTIIQRRQRVDRCYYCGATKRTLLEGDVNTPCPCIECHMEEISAQTNMRYRAWENR